MNYDTGLGNMTEFKGATPEPADQLNDELQAMRSVARMLEKLEPAVRVRVVAWVNARFADHDYGMLTGALGRTATKAWQP